MFNDIKDKVADTLGNVQKKGEELAELSKMRVRALKLSSEISAEYKSLGQLVYECRMGGFDDSETIECCVKAIAEMRRELTLLTRDIDNVTGTVRCDFCGNKNPKSETVCQKCGEPFDTVVEPEEDVDAIKAEIAQIKQNIKDLTQGQ